MDVNQALANREFMKQMRAKLKQIKKDRRELLLKACVVARLALQFVPEGEDRPRQCIEIAERWAKAEASFDALIKAGNDADVCAQKANAATMHSAGCAAYAASDLASLASAARPAEALDWALSIVGNAVGAAGYAGASEELPAAQAAMNEAIQKALGF